MFYLMLKNLDRVFLKELLTGETRCKVPVTENRKLQIIALKINQLHLTAFVFLPDPEGFAIYRLF